MTLRYSIEEPAQGLHILVISEWRDALTSVATPWVISQNLGVFDATLGFLVSFIVPSWISSFLYSGNTGFDPYATKQVL